MTRFILSKKKVLEQYNKVKGLGDIVSYSVKTNLDVAMVLKETDSMFSLHSPENIKILNCPERMWFFAQGWDKKQIKKLLSIGIRRFVVDNINDLNRLMELESGLSDVELLLRMNLKEMTIYTGRYFVYGMKAAVINSLIPKIKNRVKAVGIHFHRKTQNISEWNYKEELEQSLKKDTIKMLDYVNIGGGLPSKYKNISDRALETIIKKINELREWLHSFNIRMIIEPGRFISAPAIKLETKIINIYDNNIILDCSVYDGAMDTIVIPVKLLVQGELETGKSYVLKGNSPCSMDIFRYDVKLKNPKVGDKIIFLNAGAYNYATDFFSRKRIKTVIVE